MAEQQIPFISSDDAPDMLEAAKEIVARFRLAMAPVLNADLDNIHVHQSNMITAAALFAGMTVGHMIAVGAMKEQDKRRAGQLVLTNFRIGVELGKDEVRLAMLEQFPTEGSA